MHSVLHVRYAGLQPRRPLQVLGARGEVLRVERVRVEQRQQPQRCLREAAAARREGQREHRRHRGAAPAEPAATLVAAVTLTTLATDALADAAALAALAAADGWLQRRPAVGGLDRECERRHHYLQPRERVEQCALRGCLQDARGRWVGGGGASLKQRRLPLAAVCGKRLPALGGGRLAARRRACAARLQQLQQPVQQGVVAAPLRVRQRALLERPEEQPQRAPVEPAVELKPGQILRLLVYAATCRTRAAAIRRAATAAAAAATVGCCGRRDDSVSNDVLLAGWASAIGVLLAARATHCVRQLR